MTEEKHPIGVSVRCPECGGLSDALARDDGDLTCSFCGDRDAVRDDEPPDPEDFDGEDGTDDGPGCEDCGTPVAGDRAVRCDPCAGRRERERVRRGRLRTPEDFEREMRRERASEDIRYERDSMEPDLGPDC